VPEQRRAFGAFDMAGEPKRIVAAQQGLRRSWSGILRRSSPLRPRRSYAIRCASLHAWRERRTWKSGRPPPAGTRLAVDDDALDRKARHRGSQL
jgi:hypothetical protein